MRILLSVAAGAIAGLAFVSYVRAGANDPGRLALALGGVYTCALAARVRWDWRRPRVVNMVAFLVLVMATVVLIQVLLSSSLVSRHELDYGVIVILLAGLAAQWAWLIRTRRLRHHR